MTEDKMPPIHPGEVLNEDFLVPMGISQYRLAKDIGVHPRRINEIVHGKRAITADTALRLGRYFGIEPEFWMHLQVHHDLEIEADRLAEKLRGVKVRSASA
ncbi:MAG: HigA family addiction module antitoxin [Acidobacteriota bacterium]